MHLYFVEIFDYDDAKSFAEAICAPSRFEAKKIASKIYRYPRFQLISAQAA